MKKYKEYKDGFSYTNIEKEVLAFWKEHQVFEKSITEREGNPSFVFYEGPPSANGMPGIHHVMARTIKDIFCRYKTMQGFQVKRKAGWDTHGLPVELQVEKELGITKDDIGKKITVEEYNQACRKTVMKYTDEWEKVTEQMGYWVDMKNPYITYENDYIESVWWLLSQLHQKNLLYKGYTIQPFSPKAGSGLSSHELNMPGTYRDVSDTTVTAQFKIKQNAKSEFLFEKTDEQFAELFFLAWTTTPWTLPSNSALALGKNIEYVLVKTFNAYTFKPVMVILAKDLMGKYFSKKASKLKIEDYKEGDKKIPFEVLASFKGSDLAGVEYEQLLPYVQPEKSAFRAIIGDFVSTEDGTGIVHIAPTFGADDFRVAQQNDIPAILVKDELGNDAPLVTRQGKFVPEVTDFANRYVKAEYESEVAKDYKSTDVLIAIKLKEDNRAFNVQKYEHSYPHCWRTDKPILYYPLDSWFIRTTAMKDKLVEFNKQINWKPKSTGEGRFGNWLENLVDWNLSRQRYWGIPLPIWRNEEGTEELCIGSIAELLSAIQKANESDLLSAEEKADNQKILESAENDKIDLHRPYADQITLVQNNTKLKREKDLIDVWFDSGAMPYASAPRPPKGEKEVSSNGGKEASPNPSNGGEQFPHPLERIKRVPSPFGGQGADFIAEGVDQTRGWFFTLHAIGVMLFDSVAFKNVVSNGLVLDKDGVKMSKRLGNAVEPISTKKYIKDPKKDKKGDPTGEFYEGEYEVDGALTKFGADATRWYMISNSNPWDNLKFSWEKIYDEEKKTVTGESDGISEVQRRFLGTLKNTYSFFALYANLDGFVAEQTQKQNTSFGGREADRWIISKLNTLIKQVAEAYEDYEPTKAARFIQDFTQDDLSNWYVRLNRKRFWKSEYNADKKAAYQTLYTCLETIARLSAPIMPFYSDKLYQDLNEVNPQNSAISVHLAEFPKAKEELIDLDLEEQMRLAQTISSLTHSLRKQAKIRVRLPLSQILVPVLEKKTETQIEAVKDLILSEVNVKELNFVGDEAGILIKSVKPNFKVLGKKFKAQMKDVQKVINSFTKEDINTIERNGTLQKEGFDLVLEDVQVVSEQVEGFEVASENGVTVALDTHLNDDLKQEGLARDLVNRVQNLRKDRNLEVQDKINISIQNTDAFVQTALQTHEEYIKTETQALDIQFSKSLANAESFEIDGFEIGLDLSVV